MKVYILEIWGNTVSIHSTLKAARAKAREIREPTSRGGRRNEDKMYFEYSIVLWEEGKTKASGYWDEEFTIDAKKYYGKNYEVE